MEGIKKVEEKKVKNGGVKKMKNEVVKNEVVKKVKNRVAKNRVMKNVKPPFHVHTVNVFVFPIMKPRD